MKSHPLSAPGGDDDVDVDTFLTIDVIPLEVLLITLNIVFNIFSYKTTFVLVMYVVELVRRGLSIPLAKS